MGIYSIKNIEVSRPKLARFNANLESVVTPAVTFNQDGIILDNNTAIDLKFGFVPEKISEIINELDISNLGGTIFNKFNLSNDVISMDVKTRFGIEKVFIINHFDQGIQRPLVKNSECYTLIFTSINIDTQVLNKFSQTFSLTRAESEIAFELSSGLTPQDIAELREVSIHTIRSQVKAIKNKTGAQNINSIVRIVLLFHNAIKIKPTTN